MHTHVKLHGRAMQPTAKPCVPLCLHNHRQLSIHGAEMQAPWQRCRPQPCCGAGWLRTCGAPCTDEGTAALAPRMERRRRDTLNLSAALRSS